MKKIYIAAPVVGISDTKKEQIDNIVRILRNAIDPNREHLYEVFSPSEIKVENSWGLTLEEWSACVFNMDVKAIRDCDMIVVCDYGRQGTAGTSWEAGLAYGIGKPIFEIMCAEDGKDYSLMIHKCASNFITYNDFYRMGGYELNRSFFVERGKVQELKDVLN